MWTGACRSGCGIGIGWRRNGIGNGNGKSQRQRPDRQARRRFCAPGRHARRCYRRVVRHDGRGAAVWQSGPISLQQLIPTSVARGTPPPTHRPTMDRGRTYLPNSSPCCARRKQIPYSRTGSRVPATHCGKAEKWPIMTRKDFKAEVQRVLGAGFRYATRHNLAGNGGVEIMEINGMWRASFSDWSSDSDSLEGACLGLRDAIRGTYDRMGAAISAVTPEGARMAWIHPPIWERGQ